MRRRRHTARALGSERVRRWRVGELLVVVGIVCAVGMLGAVPFLRGQQQQSRDAVVQHHVRAAGTLLEMGATSTGSATDGGGTPPAWGRDALELLGELGYEPPPEIDLGSAEVEVAGTCVALRHRDGGEHWRYSREDGAVVAGRCDELREAVHLDRAPG